MPPRGLNMDKVPNPTTSTSCNRSDREDALQQIRQGSLTEMQKLVDNWPTDPVQILAALRVFIPHLDAPMLLVKEGASEEERKAWEDTQRRSHHVIKAIEQTMRVLYKDEQQAKKIVPILVENIEPVFSWHQFLVLTGTQGLSKSADALATFVLSYLHFHKELRSMMLASKCAMHSVILAFTVDQTEEPIAPAPFDHRLFRRLDLLFDCLSEDNSRSIVMDYIFALPSHFVKSFSLHMLLIIKNQTNLVRSAPNHHTPGETHRTAAILSYLPEALAREDTRIGSQLIKHGYVAVYFDFIAALWDVYPAQRQKLGFTGHLDSLFRWNRLYRESASSSQLCKLLDKGLLTLITNVSCIAYSEDDVECVHSALRVLESHFGRPRVLQSVHTALGNLPPATRKIATNPAAHTHSAWQGFETNLLMSSGVSKLVGGSGPVVTECDNFKGPHEHRFKSRKRQTCTGCHSVVYCSPGCQRIDWEIHRHECSNLAIIHEELKQRKLRAPQSVRFHLLSVIGDIIGGMFDRWPCNRDKILSIGPSTDTKGPRDDIEDIVPLRRFRSELRHDPMDEFIAGVRFDSMSAWVKDHPTLRLVDFSFRHSVYQLRFFCLVEPSSGRFRTKRE
ncbi:hypothetical protein FA15DRAFT_760344 [Coprinopsis marcescibilis]|uniref:MYND-type domain-containing protein n=1 Tax=Coprinopsis marcescibilis TaxID=230819 RepID=A0A5C3KFN8_COPMA|nr:hypothetical protein FA15DRAFT_760344 [Coprinopsis marcescibilis]